MRQRATNLTWLALRWPREVDSEHLTAVFRLLAASAGSPIVLEAVGTDSGVDHRIGVPSSRNGIVTGQLRAALPGIGIAELDAQVDGGLTPKRAIRLGLSTRRRPLDSDHPEHLSRALLTAISQVRRHECLVLQWVLGPSLRPIVVPNQPSPHHAESWSKALLSAAWVVPKPVDAEARTALRAKQSQPGWRAIGRIAVRAAGVPRQRQLLGQVLGALRSANGPGAHLRVMNERPARVLRATLPWRWPLTLNVDEVLAVSSWPVGPVGDLPVRIVGSRPLRAQRAIPAKGRVIGRGTWPGEERAVALFAADSLRHLHVLGPTGTGKSTLLLNLIVQDVNQGRGVVVIEPKGDLVHEVLQRIPENRINDVVLLDPTDEDRPVGLNPLKTSPGRSPDLVADQLLGVFHRLYLSSWGPRTQDILHASLLTLARLPGMTLVALPLLLGDPVFRRRVVGRVGDPLALGPFWAGFEAWSEAERTAAVAPVMNKLRPFLLRSNLRRMIGQAEPKFDVRQVFRERKILLVNLSKGRLGSETAALLGSLVVAQLWQPALERSAIPAERRHPVFMFVDEFQDYLNLPTDLGDALAEARSYGVGLTLAHQHLHQLEPAMRSAVLANARSRVCFQLGHEDARTLAAGSTVLQPDDFQSLGRFEAYAALVADASVQPWCSIQTLPPVSPSSDPAAIWAASRHRYGVPRSEIDADLAGLVGGSARSGADDLSPRRRGGGGRS